MPDISLHPDSTPTNTSIFFGNKGMLIAAAAVIVLVIIGFSALIGFNSTSQYKGMIQKVEQETQALKAQNQAD